MDVDQFRTRAENYFDHDVLGNSNTFIPVAISGALVRGCEVSVLSPRMFQRAQAHLAYSRHLAAGRAAVSSRPD